MLKDTSVLKALTFYDRYLMLILNDDKLVFIDIWSSWTNILSNLDIMQATNSKIIKLTPSRFLLFSSKLCLYSVTEHDGKLVVKSLSEILAIEYACHSKAAVTFHKSMRSEIVVTNSGKEHGVIQLEVCWKTKQLFKIETYCSGARVFDIQAMKARH